MWWKIQRNGIAGHIGVAEVVHGDRDADIS